MLPRPHFSTNWRWVGYRLASCAGVYGTVEPNRKQNREMGALLAGVLPIPASTRDRRVDLR